MKTTVEITIFVVVLGLAKMTENYMGITELPFLLGVLFWVGGICVFGGIYLLLLRGVDKLLKD